MQIPNLSNYLNSQFIFDKQPPVGSNFKYFVIILALFIPLAFLLWRLYLKKAKKLPPYKPLSQKLFNVFFYCGMMGLALSFFHWQQIVYVGSWFFFIILGIIFLFWGFSILLYRFFSFPKEVKIYREKINFEKYLPTSKSKHHN